MALGLLVQAGIGFMAIFIESYGHAVNKTWYKHVQRAVQSFLPSRDIACRTWRHHRVSHNICTWSYQEASARKGCSVLSVLFVRIVIAQTLNLQHAVIRLA